MVIPKELEIVYAHLSNFQYISQYVREKKYNDVGVK